MPAVLGRHNLAITGFPSRAAIQGAKKTAIFAALACKYCSYNLSKGL
jgi:hypothetical protein